MSHSAFRPALGMLLALLSPLLLAATPTPVGNSTTPLRNGTEIRDGSTLLRVTALSDDILRVRVAANGRFGEDASWVVSAEARGQSVEVQPLPGKASGFRTRHLSVEIARLPLRLIVRNAAGELVVADAIDRPFTWHDGAFTVRKALTAHEHIVGLGDKAGPLDRRGEEFVDWNTDAYLYQESSDPLYKSVPFYISVGAPGGSYGLYLDNTWRTWFDLGKRDPDAIEFGAPAGALEYYLIYGPTARQVVEGYTLLTGRPSLPPLWSLGYQQSRYSYMSADEVRGIASRMRHERIPADVIWLDIDYQDRNRPFTTNKATFPDLAQLAHDVGAQGFKLVAITDLHIADLPNQGYAPYDSGIAGDQFVKRPDGSRYVAEVWPGASLFPDFTRATTRDWWGGLYKEFIASGIAGFWNDMNEPAIFRTESKTMPLDTVHRIEEPGFATRSATHAEIHNIYGMQNTRATFDGEARLAPNERPYVMTRASFAGGQRYAVTWTGDNSSTWNHLRMVVPMLLNLGMSGFAYSGADVGGYAGQPTPELLTRWDEIAAFTPVFRAHSAKGSVGKEPWHDGPEQTAIRRRFIEERYRLLPYIYSLADLNARTGAPLMRPVFFDYPDSITAGCDQSTDFLLGAAMLIAPPPNLEDPAPYRICLPEGRWYDYWSGAAVVADTTLTAGWNDQSKSVVVTATPALNELPVFVRAGTILPRQPLIQSTSETPNGPLTLEVYPGDDCHGTLYLDDGHSQAYRQGHYLRQRIRCLTTADGLVVTFETRAGDYRPWWPSIDVVIHGWDGAASAQVGALTPSVESNAALHVVRVAIPDQPQVADVVVRHATAAR